MPDLCISVGHFYSNGAYGRNWGVRMATACTIDPDTGDEMIVFKGVAGSARRNNGSMPTAEFVRWVKYEVSLKENDWVRIGSPASDEPESANT
jgi:hypothetical protein